MTPKAIASRIRALLEATVDADSETLRDELVGLADELDAVDTRGRHVDPDKLDFCPRHRHVCVEPTLPCEECVGPALEPAATEGTDR